MIRNFFKGQKFAVGLLYAFMSLALLALLFQIASMIFLNLCHVSLSSARPWTIYDYFLAYRSTSNKALRIAVNCCFLLPFLVAGLVAFGIARNWHKRPLHGDARFATESEIKKAELLDPPKGLEKTILVGKYKGKYLTYPGYQFVLLAAPTRSGKGVGIVIPNCLTYSDSLVVLDIKLENYRITSGYRYQHGQEVYLFCPYDHDGRTHRYNPLDYISNEEAFRLGDIDAIASALYTSSNPSDAFWNEQAKIFFRGMCLFVLEQEDLPHTIGEILRQVSGKGKPVQEHLQEVIQRRAKEGKKFSDACIDNLNLIITAPDNTFGSIKSTFITPLKPFYNPLVDMATSASDFDLRDVRKKRISIYFGVTPDKLAECSVIVNLFFDQLINQNSRQLPEDNKELKYQCLMIMDEFTAIGKVSMIAKSVSYQAGYNMRLLTIIQNKSQLEDVYGKAGAQTLITNHGLLIIYAPATTTQQDANEYSEMLGYQTVKSSSKSISKNSSSESISDQRRALMLPQEIKEIGKWREIISCEGCKPILCDKIKYFEDPDFTKRANWKVAPIPKQDFTQFLASLKEPLNKTESTSNSANDNNTTTVDLDDTPYELDSDQIEFFMQQIVEETVTTTYKVDRKLTGEEKEESVKKLSKLVAKDGITGSVNVADLVEKSMQSLKTGDSSGDDDGMDDIAGNPDDLKDFIGDFEPPADEKINDENNESTGDHSTSAAENVEAAADQKESIHDDHETTEDELTKDGEESTGETQETEDGVTVVVPDSELAGHVEKIQSDVEKKEESVEKSSKIKTVSLAGGSLPMGHVSVRKIKILDTEAAT